MHMKGLRGLAHWGECSKTMQPDMMRVLSLDGLWLNAAGARLEHNHNLITHTGAHVIE